jgi:hypothetical protein
VGGVPLFFPLALIERLLPEGLLVGDQFATNSSSSSNTMISFTLARILLFAVVIVCLISAPKEWRQDAKSSASVSAPADYFGESAAISGDVALVGAIGVNSNRGAAYIFRSSDGGATWPSNETQKLTASDGANDDYFGYSCGISGDVALVGAYKAKIGSNTDQGAAYIFRSSDGGATWPSSETQKLTASDGAWGDYFGRSSAISGDVALVCANLGSNNNQGAAYIFRSSDGGATWPSSETQTLTASDGASNEQFGYSTAISGDVALVGAVYADVNGKSSQGAAYIFRSSDGGATWPSNETQKLTAWDGASNEQFGYSTAISGDVALVGAKNTGFPGKSNQGAAYIFRSSDGGVTWPSNDTQRLTASDGGTNNYFGKSAAISGDVALVGAIGADTLRGAAYIFGYTTVVEPSGSSSRSARAASDDSDDEFTSNDDYACS